MIKYVAFLRGINVGSHKRIGMAELKRTFEVAGFQNVTTYIASGNVIFETPEADTTVLSQKIEAQLEKTFGYHVGVILRSAEDIRELVDSNPFEGIKVTADVRLYVTFLGGEAKSALRIPYESPQRDFQILQVSETAVLSVLTLLGGSRSGDAMNMLEKEFGKKITTRNWNVISKMTALHL